MTLHVSNARVTPRWAVLAAILAMPLGGCDAFNQARDEGIVEGFRTSFPPSCTASAVRAGAPAATARQVCECAANTLIANNTPEELSSLSPADADAALRTCAAQAGITL